MTDTAHESRPALDAGMSSPATAASDEHRQAVQAAADRAGAQLSPAWAVLLAELLVELEGHHLRKAKK